MSQPKETLVDCALAIGSAGFNALVVTMIDSGQNLLSLAAAMLLVALITGVVSFLLATFVRAILLAMAGSAIITELLFLLYFVCRIAFSEHVHDHAFEELYLLPLVFALYTAPTVLFSTIGFGRLANRLYRRGTAAV